MYNVLRSLFGKLDDWWILKQLNASPLTIKREWIVR